MTQRAKTLRQRRIESDLTLSDIASRLRMSPMSILRIERGANVGAPLIVAYALALGIEPVTAFRAWHRERMRNEDHKDERAAT